MTAGRVNGGAGKNPHDRRPRGRPGMITEAHIAQVETLIAEGAMLAMIPGLMGIAKVTFYDWSKRGARFQKRQAEAGAKLTGDDLKAHKLDEPYGDFTNRLYKALAKRDKSNLSIIQRAAEGNPKIVRKVRKEREATGLDHEGRVTYTMVDVEVTETRTVEYDWRAAQYLLEKGNPNVFGPRSTLNIERALPTDPAALADMDMGDLLALASQLEAHLDGVSEDD